MSENQVSFETFILSLGTASFVALGEIDSPVTKKKEKDLQAARQNIDILEVLLEKTKGNLSDREDKLLNDILYEARLKYVNHTGEKEQSS